MYAIADDLSGAAEVAAALTGLPAGYAHIAQMPLLATPAALDLPSPGDADPAVDPGSRRPEILVVDSGNRHAAGPDAAARIRSLLAARPEGSHVFLKFDSLLRGNLDVELAAAMETGPVAFCPALPDLDRTVRNGVLRIKGIPLHETNLWQAESADPGYSIASRLTVTSPAVVPLSTIRGGDLQEVLAGHASEGRLAVCDAETDDDLDRIAAAALGQGIVLAGAAGLAAAMRRSRPAPSDASSATAPRLRQSPAMFILGTASPSTRAQLTELQQMGVPVHRLLPADIPSFDPGGEGSTAVVVEGPIDPARSAAIVQSLAQLARRAHAGRHLVLSGGETARAVLDELGIRRLHPLAQAHPGAVVSVTDSGRLVATRPGSFGDRHSLTQILLTMQALEATNPGKVSS